MMPSFRQPMRYFLLCLLPVVTALLFSSCGYHIGGLKPVALKDVHSISVGVFTNNSLEPRAGAMVSSAIAEEIQTEGTYSLLSSKEADARLEGSVASIDYMQLRSSYQDTYKSMEVGLKLNVNYKIIDNKSNKVLWTSSATAVSSLFNVGNQQSAKMNALSYATRLVAHDLCGAVSNG